MISLSEVNAPSLALLYRLNAASTAIVWGTALEENVRFFQYTVSYFSSKPLS